MDFNELFSLLYCFNQPEAVHEAVEPRRHVDEDVGPVPPRHFRKPEQPDYLGAESRLMIYYSRLDLRGLHLLD